MITKIVPTALLFLAPLGLTIPSVAQPEAANFDALHQALNLRPEQEQAWTFFKQASIPDPQDAERHREVFQKMEALQAPERMTLSVQMMRADLEKLERRAAAMKAFYLLLSPNQKETFDRETLP